MFNKVYEFVKKIIKNYYKLILLWIVVLFISFYKFPYVIYCPGGAINLKDRIVVDDDNDYDGKLQMAYVTMRRGNLPNILLSLIIPDWDIKKEEEASLKNQNIEQTMEIERHQMQSSIDVATILAYKKADKYLEITQENATVFYITDEADTTVKLLDVIKKVENKDIKNVSDIIEVVSASKENDVLNLQVERDNKIVETTAKVYLDAQGNLKIGIGAFTTYEYNTDPKIKVTQKTSEAGTSGGLMLSLAIYNALVNDDITHGKTIIGTGTISLDGTVGEIDGVKYKLIGAANKKADIFLCPKENYAEAVTVKEEYKLDIKLVSVSTFDEALDYLKTLN